MSMNLELRRSLRVNPPFGTQYSGFFRRYAVRKGLVRSTQRFGTQYAKVWYAKVWYAVRKGLVRSTQRIGTQYAKVWYAVRKNPVVSYADIDFFFKKVLANTNTTNTTQNSYFSRARDYIAHFFIYKTSIIGIQTLKKSSKHNKTNVCLNVCACACHILSFYVNGNVKKYCLCC